MTTRPAMVRAVRRKPAVFAPSGKTSTDAAHPRGGARAMGRTTDCRYPAVGTNVGRSGAETIPDGDDKLRTAGEVESGERTSTRRGGCGDPGRGFVWRGDEQGADPARRPAARAPLHP